MKKRLVVSAILCLTLLVIITTFASAEGIETDQPPEVSVYIDGELANFNVPSILLNETTYVPIREFSMALGAENVLWDYGSVSVTAPNLNMNVNVGEIYFEANGRYLYLANGSALRNGSVMIPVRPLAEAFGAEVVWDGALNTVYVMSGTGTIEDGISFYDDNDVYWMSRIISAEARGESLVGKIAVGGVIMNRIASPIFPDTVYDVIFDKQYGIQFTPAYSGAIYCTPNEECIIAAKIALDGGNTAGNSLYFASSNNCWAARARPFAMTIGNHYFYA
jgi:N-acetylmuramoyl-L-alanine amidase